MTQDQATFSQQPDILVVDDAPDNLRLLTKVLTTRGFKVRPARSGELALQGVRSRRPSLILLDIRMPGMNGYDVCRRLKSDEKLKDIPIIFLTALYDREDKVEAFAAGAVDYITKPFATEEVVARVEVHLKLRQQIELEKHNGRLQALVQEQLIEIAGSQMATILALAKLSESRDDATGRHLERVQLYCKLLATALGGQQRHSSTVNQTFIGNIFHASPLHDIGKVAIPDAILLKSGALTPEERKVMNTHATIGALTLEAVRERYPKNMFINMGIAIARSHHERWDGSGYPNGLVGPDIPLSARIMAVADVYDAIRAKRPYKPPQPHTEARDVILRGKGSAFDPDVVEAFLAAEAGIEPAQEK
jgi:putative two-component system response regulator